MATSRNFKGNVPKSGDKESWPSGEKGLGYFPSKDIAFWDANSKEKASNG